jgi:predicted neutral ceramidase superfamily lipid hydrolase
MMNNKELDIILSILTVLLLPTLIGKITNIIFKIKSNGFLNTWYTGIWSLFFITVLVVFLFSTYTTIIK